jgi:hypothetical protein
MTDGDLSPRQNDCPVPQDHHGLRDGELLSIVAIDVDLYSCELKFEDERTGRFAKIYLDLRANQSL